MVGADVVTIGTILGALIGVITFLLRILVAAKTEHIADLEKQRDDILAERNLFRDLTLTSSSRERGHHVADE